MKEFRILLASLLLCAMTSEVWGDTYVKVTSTNQLVVGDIYIIASPKGVAISYASKLPVTKSGYTENLETIITSTTEPLEFVLGEMNNSYTLLMYDNSYLGWDSSTNFRNTQTVATDTKEQWNINYNNTYNMFTIVNKKSTRHIGYNGSNSFGPYTNMSSNAPATLYKKQANKSTSDLTITKSTIDLALGETNTEDIAFTTSSNGTMHFTSNDTGIATVDVDGRVTAVAEGSTTITVSQDEGTSHLASEEQTITVNVTDSRSPAATITAISPSGSINVGDMGYFALTKTENDDSGVTYTYVTDDATILDVTSDGMYSGEKGGTANITVTATPTNLSSYKPVSAVFPFSVVNTNKTPTVITLGEDNASVTYGETYNLLAEITSGYEGDISYTISNPAIATIETTEEGYVITPLAVGTTTITFSAAETANYSAAENAVFTFTVNDNGASVPGNQVLLEDHFTNVTLQTYYDLDPAVCDYNGWTAISTVHGADAFIWIATASNDGSMSTGTLNGLKKGAALAFKAYGDNAGNVLTLTPTGCTLEQTTITTTADWETYTIQITSVTNNPSIRFSAKKGKQVNLDDIIISQPQSDIPVTIAANKEWVTYCSPYVLDFTDDVEDLQGAYYVNGHDDKATTLTVTKIAGKVPAKTGMLLHVTPSAETQTIKLPIGDTGTPLSGNKLVGVLSPTYIEPTSGVNTNLGLAGGEFVGFNNAGIIGANKAYLQIPTSEMPTEDNGDAKLTIIIDDSDTAAIKAIENEQYPTTISMYNIAGQRVNGSYKGIVIHNGKKSVVK